MSSRIVANISCSTSLHLCIAMTYFVGADAAQHHHALEVMQFAVPGLGQVGLMRRAVVIVDTPLIRVVVHMLSALMHDTCQHGLLLLLYFIITKIYEAPYIWGQPVHTCNHKDNKYKLLQ